MIQNMNLAIIRKRICSIYHSRGSTTFYLSNQNRHFIF